MQGHRAPRALRSPSHGCARLRPQRWSRCRYPPLQRSRVHRPLGGSRARPLRDARALLRRLCHPTANPVAAARDLAGECRCGGGHAVGSGGGGPAVETNQPPRACELVFPGRVAGRVRETPPGKRVPHGAAGPTATHARPKRGSRRDPAGAFMRIRPVDWPSRK